MLSLGIAAFLAAGAAFAWQYRVDVKRSLERAQLPEAEDYVAPSLAPTSPAKKASPSPLQSAAPQPATNAVLPSEINLAVPFTPQAPHANWEYPYKEFCEEASVYMTMKYIKKETIASPEVADRDMLAIKDFEETTFGYYEDTTAAETATILTDYYDYPNVALLENPTPLQIRQALAAKKLVIMPAAGRLLGNPYFQTPGPLYHMLVIKGYTADGKFIVNDPGTRRGADFVYEEGVLMHAMHDWRADEQIEQGRKVVLVAG